LQTRTACGGDPTPAALTRFVGAIGKSERHRLRTRVRERLSDLVVLALNADVPGRADIPHLVQDIDRFLEGLDALAGRAARTIIATMPSQNPPAPMPTLTRPPVSRPRVAAARVVTAGCRSGRFRTSGAR
jgi:hypothetical protein